MENKNQKGENEKAAQKKYWWYFGIFIFLVFIALSLPYILNYGPYIVGFNESTAHVGDTIGGILGSTVAIIAAWLTFMAFWTQYKANSQLKDEQNAQRKEMLIDRLENKFYEMLRLHKQNVEEIEINIEGKICKGRAAIQELFFELLLSYKIVSKITDILFIDNKYDEIKRDSRLEIFKIELSYGYFFYGEDYFISRENSLWKDLNADITSYIEKIKEIPFTYEKTSFTSIEKNAANVVEEIFRNLQQEEKERREGIFSSIKMYAYIPYPLFEGHNSSLGHYFRHLFQTVKFIAATEDKLLEEKQKYSYVKLLRAQLSDLEQTLLYYNSLSIMGKIWNKGIATEGVEKMNYIARFKLIKNIPFYIEYFGIKPESIYKAEIAVWESKNEKFFEHNIR